MAAVVYAWVRAVEVALFPQVDPRTTFGVVQSGYLLRCAVAAFGAGMGVFAGVALGSEPRRAARALVLAVAIAAAAIALQAAFSP